MGLASYKGTFLPMSLRRSITAIVLSLLLLAAAGCGEADLPSSGSEAKSESPVETTETARPEPSKESTEAPESGTEEESPEETGETETEESTEEASAEVPEVDPGEPDPRLDVLKHYPDLFVVTGVSNCLYIRNQASTAGMIIGKMDPNTAGAVLEDKGNGWYRIASGGIEGYISANYVTRGIDADLLAVDLSREKVYASSAEAPNVRTGPGTEYEIEGQLNPKTPLPVEEDLGDWVQVSYNGNPGYVSKDVSRTGYFLDEAVPWSSYSGASAPRQEVIRYGQQFMGTRYVFGGTSLTGGLDCSSFTQQCFRNAIGLSLPRLSYEQVNRGAAITMADAKPGDLLFYNAEGAGVDHVAIYIGDGKILHSALSQGGVTISAYNYVGEPCAVRNVIGD